MLKALTTVRVDEIDTNGIITKATPLLTTLMDDQELDVQFILTGPIEVGSEVVLIGDMTFRGPVTPIR